MGGFIPGVVCHVGLGSSMSPYSVRCVHVEGWWRGFSTRGSGDVFGEDLRRLGRRGDGDGEGVGVGEGGTPQISCGRVTHRVNPVLGRTRCIQFDSFGEEEVLREVNPRQGV